MHVGQRSKFSWGLPLLVLLLAPMLLIARALPMSPARAAGVVSVCDEAHFDSALAGGGAVTFGCGTSPVTITVTSQKVISFSTSIDGGGLVTLSGGGTTSILDVNPGVTLTLKNVTIANGHTTGNGGGIYNTGNLNAANVTFDGNSALNGAGIYNSLGSAALTGVTFSNNFASSNGGGMDVQSSSVALTNSTFYSNTALIGNGGGMLNSSSAVTLTNITLNGNFAGSGGGAIVNSSGSATVRNSILWGDSPDEMDSISITPTVSYSIVHGGFAGIGNLNSNPNLGPLANNGGPTLTLALLAGSPAVNLAIGNCPATDQRGMRRPGAPTVCDSGSFQTVVILNLPLILR